MICPYCHQEIPQGSDRCPHCGRSIVQKPIEEEPRLSRGMKVFIAVGGALLAAFTIYNAVSHFGDPEYTRTPSYLEPDSTLIEKLAEPTDLVSVDTAAADSIKQLEKEAKKVYNSIRRPQRNEEDKESEASSETSSEGEASSSDDAASTAPSSAPSPSVSAPKVEAHRQRVVSPSPQSSTWKSIR